MRMVTLPNGLLAVERTEAEQAVAFSPSTERVREVMGMSEQPLVDAEGTDEYERLLAALDMADVVVRKTGLTVFREMRDRFKVQPHTIVADADLNTLFALVTAATALSRHIDVEGRAGRIGFEFSSALLAADAVLDRFIHEEQS